MSKENRTPQEENDRWKRLLIALNDLTESKRYVEAHVAFADTPAYLEAYGALGTEMAGYMENALLSHGLIAYARPFTQSRGGKWKKVPGRFTSRFTTEERRIHNYVLEARRKLIAHSDLEGIHTDSHKTESGDLILSVHPVPVVMILGEEDSLNLSVAAKQARRSVQNTFDEVRRFVQNLEPPRRALKVILREDRMFDIDVEHCIALIEMIDKVDDAISEELGFIPADNP